MTTPFRQLRQLAGLYGVQTAYSGADGRPKRASGDVLMATLAALGAPLSRRSDVPAALRARRIALAGEGLAPVAVAWDGRRCAPTLRLPAAVGAPADCRLVLEDGETRAWTATPAGHPVAGHPVAGHPVAGYPVAVEETVEGVTYRRARLTVPGPLPLGYHRLEVEIGGRSFVCQVISAPRRAWSPFPSPPPGDTGTVPGRPWGAILPLYAARSGRTWGVGDFAELDALGEWVASLGGSVVATLPLLPAFLDELFNPSPYAPASRLFWNELYIDVEALPELSENEEARSLVGAPEFRAQVAALRAMPLVDYAGVMALKRCVLERLAGGFFAAPGGPPDAFRRFVAAQPDVESYARFRATTERRRLPWTTWPAALRDAGRSGEIPAEAFDDGVRRYHLYCQWSAHRQMSAIGARARDRGLGLYLDFPLGVNPDGFDVWRERETFALGVRAGAPPDAFFTGGQDWGFPPLHPQRSRIQGYRHFAGALRHHLRHAGVLRLDHVMGFHRLYWIPEGVPADQGVYVRYPADDFYAMLTLESHRNRTLLVGENLGTVPPYVNPTLERHGVHGMYVMQYAIPGPDRPPDAVPPRAVASLNTHDAPPFKGFWDALDVDDQLDLGLIDGARAEASRHYRWALRWGLAQTLASWGLLHGAPDDPRAVLSAALAALGQGPAALVLVNLEDLWLEQRPQNVPGTWHERPNWRRPARYDRETFSGMEEVLALLRRVDDTRRRAP